MTAPLESLKRNIETARLGRCWVSIPEETLVSYLAAIEERDAEIATLTRQLAEAKSHARTLGIERNHALSNLQRMTDAFSDMDKEASVQRERANGLEYQCGVYEKRIEEINARWSRFFAMCGVNDPPSLADAERMFPQHGTDAFLYTLECSQAVLEGHEAMRSKLARYEQAEREIWDRTPGWVGEQLPELAAYLAGVEQQRDAMRGVLEEIAAASEYPEDHPFRDSFGDYADADMGNCDDVARSARREEAHRLSLIARRALGAL